MTSNKVLSIYDERLYMRPPLFEDLPIGTVFRLKDSPSNLWYLKFEDKHGLNALLLGDFIAVYFEADQQTIPVYNPELVLKDE